MPPLGGPLGVDSAAPWPRPCVSAEASDTGPRCSSGRRPSSELHRGPVTMTGDEARAAILAHLDRIDRAERIFVYDKEGYASRTFSRVCARAMVGNTPRLTGAARVVNFPDHGRLAQLAERWPHMPEVTGSSPVSSTTQPHVSATPDKPPR